MGAADCTPSGRPCNPLDTSDPLYDAFRRSDHYGTLGRKPQPVLEYIRLAVLAVVLVPIKFVGALLCVLAFHIICRWAPTLAHTGCGCYHVLHFPIPSPATAAEQHLLLHIYMQLYYCRLSEFHCAFWCLELALGAAGPCLLQSAVAVPCDTVAASVCCNTCQVRPLPQPPA